ncbi:SDR family NAD(P)-dependent oxidoreductase [Microcella alkalica]|uniref:NAD(P)-dependent dehydrogenase (Short-subunit alcohol dehydrogenase family) n=1 Tax=Microcella alkalica TaxID=355930 RepID=A0A839E7M2_9MICO|nr:SDR family NAD(P)-dependent oxidoreductase [Microcella alkalica]MBA8848649.1 NAD(P)-dependent dehydrogenase (short-subunit alcohol dehydrogenase family) [Microcella alkalica]
MTVHDITRPTALLTGPTSGIGGGMLQALIRHPRRPNLVLIARDAQRLEAAVGQARAAGLGARGILCDLGDLESVRRALDELASLQATDRLGGIDAALLNAGTHYMDRRHVGAQGHELTFTVNVIAQHLLVRGLEPLLAPGGHVVVMGSSSHRGKRQSFNLVPDPQWQEPAALARIDETDAPTTAAGRERGGIAYASSKLALVTVAHRWAARLGEAGRRLNVYDPGLTVGTGLVRELSPFRYWVWRRILPVLAIHPKATTSRITGRHAVALALGDANADLHDGYVEIGRLTKAEEVTFDGERQQELWTWLEDAVAPFLRSGRTERSSADTTA